MEDALYRWTLAAILLGAIVGSGVLRHRARRHGQTIRRRNEGAAMIVLRLAFGLPLLASILAFIAVPRWIGWSGVALPEWVRVVGLGLAAAGALLALWALLCLDRNVSETTLTRPGQELVTRGPYARVRHPLYAAGGLLLLGATLASTSWLVGALALVAIAMVRVIVVPREEAALVERFGRAYLDYRDRTGALLPRW